MEGSDMVNRVNRVNRAMPTRRQMLESFALLAALTGSASDCIDMKF